MKNGEPADTRQVNNSIVGSEMSQVAADLFNFSTEWRANLAENDTDFSTHLPSSMSKSGTRWERSGRRRHRVYAYAWRAPWHFYHQQRSRNVPGSDRSRRCVIKLECGVCT